MERAESASNNPPLPHRPESSRRSVIVECGLVVLSTAHTTGYVTAKFNSLSNLLLIRYMLLQGTVACDLNRVINSFYFVSYLQ